jgi:hypothetical protein
MVGIDRGFGEDDPAYDASQSDNDPYWRAAQVCVFGTKPIRVRPPRKHQRLATDFKIRVLSGGSVGVVLQADDYLFEIYDVVRHRRAAFLYTGASLSVGIPQLPGFGGLGVAGPWTYFTTDREAELHQFNTRASLYVDPGAAIGPYPIGGTLRLTLKEVHDAAGLIFTRPRIIPVSATTLVTSPSLGSAGDGVLALVSRGSP